MSLTQLAFYFWNGIYIFELINTDYFILKGTRIEEGTVTHSAIYLLQIKIKVQYLTFYFKRFKNKNLLQLIVSCQIDELQK